MSAQRECGVSHTPEHAGRTTEIVVGVDRVSGEWLKMKTDAPT
jgi:hypothetical protein